MKKTLFFLVAITLTISPNSCQAEPNKQTTYSKSVSKPVGACKKNNFIKAYKKKIYTCTEYNGKLYWDNGRFINNNVDPDPIQANNLSDPGAVPIIEKNVPIQIDSQEVKVSPVDPDLYSKNESVTDLNIPKDFSDLYQNRLGISKAAWSISSEIIKSNNARYGDIQVYTGPNTKPYFDDYRGPIGLVTRLFPNNNIPDKTILIRYNFSDLAWAENLTKEILPQNEYNRFQGIERNQLVSSNCTISIVTCRGSKQQTALNKTSMIFQGVPNSLISSDPMAFLRYTTGAQYSHEYFHSMQRIPIIGKTDIWPPAWFREGSAEWVANATINYQDFKSYENFLNTDCYSVCSNLSELNIKNFLESKNESNIPYGLAAYIVEALVALEGPDSLIDIYAQMGNKNSFDEAFKNVYGVELSYAIPILSKTIYENLKK